MNVNLPNLDKRIKMDSSGHETTKTDNLPTHPSILVVFRTGHILEEICSHLELNDLKQFRLLSRTCNNEGRRAIIKLERHWVIVKSEDDDWHLELDTFLSNLETTSAVGENCNQKLLGWIFRRLLFIDWRQSLGKLYLLQQWGPYLRRIHFNTGYCEDKESLKFDISHVIITIHKLLSECCPNLAEMVVAIEKGKEGDFSSALVTHLDDLVFSCPLLKLKCLRIKHLQSPGYLLSQEMPILQRFFTRLVIAAGSALQKFEIDYDYGRTQGIMEEMMLDSISENADDSNFQSLQEITIETATHLGNLSRTVQTCFPKLQKLLIHNFFSIAMVLSMRNPARYQVFPQSFPALKSLIILDIGYEFITNENILYFLQHFPNLEELKLSTIQTTEKWPEIPDPLAPRAQALRSLTFKTEHYDLPLLRCVVKLFPDIVTLNLLEFGKGNVNHICKLEPEYNFAELIDATSPLSCLQHLYVNHAFHTSPQLVDAIKLKSHLAALDTFILSQAAHDYTKHGFNVSLYLTNSDPEFRIVLDCDWGRRLGSVKLLDFRFGSTEEEVKDEAAAKGGHVSFESICPCHLQPWICDSPKACHNSG